MFKSERGKGKKSRAIPTRKENRASKSKETSGIDKSQRLLQCTRKTRSSAKRALSQTKTLKICSKQAIPPLLVLEKMYEDSDEEMTENIKLSKQNNSSHVDIVSGQSCSSSSNLLISPTVAKNYADELLKILNTETPPHPVIPIKKYKKPEVPYIVGCAERPQIPVKSDCSVFKGDGYGISSKTNTLHNSANCQDKIQGYYCGGYNVHKSIFNVQNEIAEKLLLMENKQANSGSDTDDTEVYQLNSPKNRFSPEPSTSRDNKTILKNDQKLIESLIANTKCLGEDDNTIKQDGKLCGCNSEQICSKSKSNKQDLAVFDNSDIEIITEPCDIIEIIDDDNTMKPSTPIKSNNNNNYSIIELEDDDYVPTNTNKINDIKGKTQCNRNIIESESPIIVKDKNYCSSLIPNIIAEIDLTNINVNDVIAENRSLINKYNTSSTVNIVEADVTNTSMANTNRVTNKHIDTNIGKTINNHLSNVTSPKIKNNLPQNVETSRILFLGTCPICLDDLLRDTVASTNCGHLFCMPCVKRALKSNPKTCPTCRKKLTGAGYHQIYL